MLERMSVFWKMDIIIDLFMDEIIFKDNYQISFICGL